MTDRCQSFSTGGQKDEETDGQLRSSIWAGHMAFESIHSARAHGNQTVFFFPLQVFSTHGGSAAFGRSEMTPCFFSARTLLIPIRLGFRTFGSWLRKTKARIRRLHLSLSPSCNNSSRCSAREEINAMFLAFPPVFEVLRQIRVPTWTLSRSQ